MVMQKRESYQNVVNHSQTWQMFSLQSFLCSVASFARFQLLQFSSLFAVCIHVCVYFISLIVVILQQVSSERCDSGQNLFSPCAHQNKTHGNTDNKTGKHRNRYTPYCTLINVAVLTAEWSDEYTLPTEVVYRSGQVVGWQPSVCGAHYCLIVRMIAFKLAMNGH